MINENVFVNLNPIKGLNIRSAVGLQWYDYRYSYQCYPVEPFDVGGANETFERYANWTVTNTAEYKFDILGKHYVTILAGQETMTSKNESFGVTTNG